MTYTIASILVLILIAIFPLLIGSSKKPSKGIGNEPKPDKKEAVSSY